MSRALLLDPQDLLFCRDGRPIVPGEGAAAGSQLPGPQVVAGALRSAVLKHRTDFSGPVATADAIAAVKRLHLRGPLLYAASDITLNDGRRIPQGPLIPMPSDVVGTAAKHGKPGQPNDRLAPESAVPGWQAPVDAPHALALWPCMRYTSPADPQQEQEQPGSSPLPRHWLSWPGFVSWSQGKTPAAESVLHESDLFSQESRTQVGLKPDQATAEDGVLFTTHYLRLRRDIHLYVELHGETESLPETGVLHLGGDRRLARWRNCPPIAWPTVPTGPCVALALTPSLMDAGDGRCPSLWRSACRGLAIPGSDPISGWDLEHRRPRPVRWALQAGSVWHLDANAERPPLCGRENDTGHGWMAYGSPPSSP